MGMFDEIRCKVPLPVRIGVDHTEHWFQTKSLACQLDCYEIREDGSLWREKYDIEDKSNPNATGLIAIQGAATRVRKLWIPCLAFTGEIKFYTHPSNIKDKNGPLSGWVELSDYFVRGQLRQFELLQYRQPG